MTAANGCTGTASKVVMLLPAPTAIATNNGPVCEGQTAILTASGGATYSWMGPAGTSTSQTITLANATLSKQGVYTVTVTSANGCTSTATTLLKVRATPVISISGNTQFCMGGTTTLDAGAGYAAYTWSSGQTTNAITVSTTGVYSVTVSSGNGCTDTDVVAVTANALPSATASNDSPACPGESVVLSATGGTSYSWSGPGGTSNSQNPTISNVGPTKAGIYTVTVTANGCTSTATTELVVSKRPKISSAVQSCPNGLGKVKITAQSQPAANGVEYSINGGTSYQASNVFTGLANGTYTIVVRDLVTGCTKDMSITVSCNAAKTEVSESALTDLQVYPNPFAGETNILFTLPETADVTVRIYGLDGKEVANLFSDQAEGGELYNLTFDGSNLSVGVYILRVATDKGEVQTQQLVISR